MAKKKLGPGKCVHCLKDVEERNFDHVFPESWYPDSTPPDLEKWQIPSCIPCNSDYGRLEQDFLLKIGLCLDPFDPASKSIVEKTLRSLKSSAARNPRDARHRLGKGRKILTEALQGGQIPDHGIFPGLGNRRANVNEEPVAVLVPAESFQRITEKIVRGIYYIEDGIFIEPPYEIEFYALPENDIAPWKDALDRFGSVYAREPGIMVRRAVAHEDGISSLFEITFWKQFKTYASVSLSGEGQQEGPMSNDRPAKDEKPDEEHLAWAIDQRAEVQHTLRALYGFVRHHPPASLALDPKYLLDHLIGAAFSLWRAVFLADTFRDDIRIHQSQEAFLLKVITDNAITFADDKANRHWTVEYYLENAKFRLASAIAYADHHKGTRLTERLMPFLRLRGMRGAELTRYEWESAHYALRKLFKVIAPDTDLEAKSPTLPKPEGLDAFLHR